MKKILVANRGEIALRIMKTARKMGYTCIAVHSEIDRDSPHVQYADESELLANGYLDIPGILKAAKRRQAGMIHPGYGFLSENADFAEAVEEAGITWIGPPSDAIRTMGNKIAAKKAVDKYDVPLIPGTIEAVSSAEEALKISERVGFPLMIKAAAGGGGKGMRIVHQEDELESNLYRAMSEAQNAFGDGAVFIEKYITRSQHIEFQIIADNHGNIIHINERECSIQRRHQKIIEETPSPSMTPKLRKAMGEAAINVARSCDYRGAGTVEFMLTPEREFYFLEMNTRLQVEHPVTELTHGLDIVALQIGIANNDMLTLEQKDVVQHGHAIELRINAENPENDFLPECGYIERFEFCEGPEVRLDSGYVSGQEVPIDYDPMLAKLIVYGKDRETCIENMLHTLSNSSVVGIPTTIPFAQFALQHPAFVSGHYDTSFVEEHFDPKYLEEQSAAREKLAAIFASKFKDNWDAKKDILTNTLTESSSWQARGRS